MKLESFGHASHQNSTMQLWQLTLVSQFLQCQCNNWNATNNAVESTGQPNPIQLGTLIRPMTWDVCVTWTPSSELPTSAWPYLCLSITHGATHIERQSIIHLLVVSTSYSIIIQKWSPQQHCTIVCTYPTTPLEVLWLPPQHPLGCCTWELPNMLWVSYQIISLSPSPIHPYIFFLSSFSSLLHN